MCSGFFFVILHIEGCFECCVLFCVVCVIVLYWIVLCCPVLHCSTLPPGINPFAVNNNNNNNNNFLCPVLSKSDTRHTKLYPRPQLQLLFHSVHFTTLTTDRQYYADIFLCQISSTSVRKCATPFRMALSRSSQNSALPDSASHRQLHTVLWNSDQADSCHEQVARRYGLHIRHYMLHRKVR